MFGKLFGKQSSEKDSESTSRRVKVGWLFKDDLGTVVWNEPKPVNLNHAKPTSAKSA